MWLRSLIVLGWLGYPNLIAGRPFETASSDNTPIVDLGYAKYEGTFLNVGVNQFLGMRYAAPPLGDLRWREPQDPLHEDGIQPAKEFAPTCIGTAGVLSNATNEDCLFLDIFTPSNATPNSKLPVWFFIQGGGYATNSDQNFNGTEVVSKSNSSMVFVQLNYRVGAFGFLASEKIRENGDLNVGLLDQQKALQWTQKYIHLFGGDPNHVVIHGDSAGGGSVAYHLTAYGGEREKLFVGAIPESPFLPTHRTVAESEFQFARFVANVSCEHDADVMSCLRSKDAATLQSADVASRFPGTEETPLWYFLPVIDGIFSPADLYTLFEQGRVTRVPIMVGDDNDEGTAFSPNASTSSEFLEFMQANYPRLTPADLQVINKTYPPGQHLPLHARYFPPAAKAYGESTFTCPGIEIATSLATHYSSMKTWSYRYNVWDAEYELVGLGVPHVAEKPALYGPGNAGACDNCSYLTYNAPMVPIVMDYWISFILTLDPNTHRHYTAPEWEPWGPHGSQRLRFQLNATAMESVPNDQMRRCAIWKSLAKTMQQ
ncbi:hypothetical protein N7474_005936 [Penicillium riverlandense]|uniref:uncharacterized protein n=1 Tax=Penicillium riverlandense TaxID=1903569 RepID=UPI0025495497|nr:uncharacterized protein N7474_005936 [Penicillium riverlandense]KAJ5820345.1 hypothetical protein N7474_005936 [Penicillium riverlandense]